MRKILPDYFRSLIFGAEDSLVSTVGVIFGIASANQNKSNILLTGLIVVAVESLSMGAGSFLTETSTHELDGRKKHRASPVVSGVIMFFSYFLTGFIPLFPYVFLEINVAKYLSVGVTLIALFILGYLPSRTFRGGLRMVTVAGAAVFMGFLIGNYFKAA